MRPVEHIPAGGRRTGFARLIPVVLFCGLALAATAPRAGAQSDARSGGSRLEIIRPADMFRGQDGDRIRREQASRLEILRSRSDDVHRLLGPRMVSRRGLDRLSRQGLGPALLEYGADPSKRLEKAETLDVVLIRIGFETDRSGDLTSITEDGGFQLAVDDSTEYKYPIDTPPHDKGYFQDHLDGLSQYYEFQSGGRLKINSRVLPVANDRCYKLSDIADYGPGEGASWTIAQLETLVIDMIELADAETQKDGSIDLSDYARENTYVIFVHAGGDWQSDVLGDSPNDIPTFFVSLGDSVPLISGASLRECSIIPETTSQDGLLGSIAGALYHEFGHSLGLPDIYDTGSGLPRVGYWDLMDSGPNLVAGFYIPDPLDSDTLMDVYVAGAVPPSMGAWCRWFLGWLDAGVITGGEHSYRLPASQIPRTSYDRWYSGTANDGSSFDFDADYPQVLIGGASDRDFFLVENRWVPKLDWSDIPDRTGVGPYKTDNNVILFMAGDPGDPTDPYPWRNTGYYDWFQPGGGLLVWHVNRELIQAGLPDNTINVGGMGLRLVEADGLQDVGVFSGYPIGIMGSAADPFHAGINTRLSVDGRPSSHAYDGSRTGFFMSDISDERPTMRFQAGVAPLSDASPLLPLARDGKIPRRLDAGTLTPAGLRIGAADHQALFFADEPDSAGGDLWLYCLDQDGAPLLLPDDPAWPDGAVLKLASPLAGAPLVDPDAPDGGELLIGTRDGLVTAYALESDDGTLKTRWGPTDLGEPLLHAPAVTRTPYGVRYVTVSLGGGRLRTLDDDGVPVGPAFVPEFVPSDDVEGDPLTGIGDLIAAPLVQRTAAGSQLILFGSEGWALHGPPNPGTWLMPPYVGEPPVATGVLSTGETGLLVTCDGDGRLTAVETASPQVAERWDCTLDGAPLGDPAIADLDGDGRRDILVLTADRLYAFDAAGVPLTGYPLALLDQYPLSPDLAFMPGLAVFDATGDGYPEVYANSNRGHLFGFDSAGRLLDGLPLLWGGRTCGPPVVGSDRDGGRILWLTERGGRESLGGYGETQVDGRIVGYLPQSREDHGRTAEWLGPRGGASRRGSVGDVAVLEAADPALPDEDLCFAYPNPARGDDVAFRVHPGGDGVLRVTVYNLEGERITSLETPVLADVASEVRWPLAGFPSGLYLCRVERPVSGGVAHHLLTLAVER